MDQDSSNRRDFSRTRQAWYAQPPLDNGMYDNEEVMICLDYDNGAVSGEFAVRWVTVSGQPTAQLQAFDDSWHLFPHFADLFQEMAKMPNNVSIDEFCSCLQRLGIQDNTPRRAPASVAAYTRALKSGA